MKKLFFALLMLLASLDAGAQQINGLLNGAAIEGSDYTICDQSNVTNKCPYSAVLTYIQANISGGGSVTSVGTTVPAPLTATGCTITTVGVCAISWTLGQPANEVLATPNGSSGPIGLRALVAADVPNPLNQNTTGQAGTAVAFAATPSQCSGSQFATGITASGAANCSSPAGAGTVTSVATTVPSPLTATGCTITVSGTCAITWTTGETANEFLATPNGTSGVVGLRTIVAADIPLLTATQMPAFTGDTTTSAGSVATTTNGSRTQFTAVSTATLLSATNTSVIVSGATTITLPTAVSEVHTYCVTVAAGSSNTVSIATTSSQTIQGSAAPATLSGPGNGACFNSDNSNWWY
jgi:hypothetical protein